MKYYALSGRPSKRKAFVVTVIITIITSFLFYHMIKLHNAHNTAIDFYQRRVASLEKRILVLEKKIAQYQYDLNEQITVIGDVMQGSLSMEARKQMNGVRRVLQSLAAPRFKHRPETSHLDCRRLFHEDKQYIAEVTRARIELIESSVLDMDCDAVRWRVLPRLQPPTIKYGIAFARIVYTDYEFLEEQLQVNYSPENHYCYHVDSKSPAVFKERMANLSSCLPNVYLTDEVLEIDGRVGTNMNFAHMACLKLLEKKGTWEYVVLQQNHDVVIRTNEELKHIFQALNGSNDVQINPCSSYFCDKSLTWDAESLDVFQGSGFRPSSEALRTPLFLVKGAVQVSLTRKAVEWLNRINLTKLISQFNSGRRFFEVLAKNNLTQD
ncbi:Core-2/I-Branching enzyme [Trichostrongylus colubriformis]|uniref:Core-2/I-Branching enzyme n=1 Tax=Trichostrongylus colubriformis TaxID=6319 RepID=A0AAN8EV00_TRICO